jgi:hypothetical protein
MPVEQLVLYALVGGFTLLQLLAGALKRRRDAELERQSPETAESDAGEPWWDPVPETAPPQVRVEDKRPPAAPRPRVRERSALRPAAAQARRQIRASHAAQHRATLKNRAELRRAVELMAILGPPRSRVSDEP